jgi:hypothetical protein
MPFIKLTMVSRRPSADDFVWFNTDNIMSVATYESGSTVTCVDVMEYLVTESPDEIVFAIEQTEYSSERNKEDARKGRAVV